MAFLHLRAYTPTGSTRACGKVKKRKEGTGIVKELENKVERQAGGQETRKNEKAARREQEREKEKKRRGRGRGGYLLVT